MLIVAENTIIFSKIFDLKDIILSYKDSSLNLHYINPAILGQVIGAVQEMGTVQFHLLLEVVTGQEMGMVHFHLLLEVVSEQGRGTITFTCY